ncbi:MAG: DUF1549 and DUF1553 domain-containing protein [Pirellulaceae bacterium]
MNSLPKLLLSLSASLSLLVVGQGARAGEIAGEKEVASESAAVVDLDKLDNAARRWSAQGEGGTPSFVKHVVPMFNKVGCSARTCHGSFQGQAGFRLSLFGYDPALDHAELTADQERGPRVVTTNDKVDDSLALVKPTSEFDHEGGQVLQAGGWRHRVLRDWIAAGASYDAKTAPYLARLEVIPREVRLQAGEKVQLRTVAWFNDGTCEEVTPLTTFASNDDSVAQVTGEGLITADGLGDTSIVVSYAGGVVTAHVLVPQQPAGEFPDFPANSPLDEFVAAKLRKLGVHPSPLCTDEEFLRRVHIDLIGTLPTSGEVRDFLADTSPDKRRRVIDALLNRPEYGMYWATQFSDALGNNSSNFNSTFKVQNLVHDWLRDKLHRNVPYDQLVGGIITATSREGRPLDEYLAEVETVRTNIEPKSGFDDGTYAKRQTLDLYWMRRMPDRDKALATRAANAFLGVQIQCAECHKHPFDRWTQDDFEGFSSFFRVVQYTALDGGERKINRLDYHQVALYPGPDKRFGQLVKTHPPKILAGEVVPYEEGGQDPRVELWNWMRRPDNPYFAKNIANRLWAHHLGRGVVDPVDDQSAANPPSNPELLDWLAQDFIEHGFDLKHLHRRILNSRTYQLSHLPNDTNRGDKRNFSHALVQRMPAEAALDALARVTDTKLDFTSYTTPPGTRAIDIANASRFGDSEYFMDIFGRPAREQTCACERSSEASLAQALFLINDDDIHTRIADPQGRVARLLKHTPDDRELIDELYLTCLSRFPTDQERKTVLDFVAQSESRAAAMQDVLWSLINVREFVFVK